jgi:hypothetical protein
LIIQFTEKTIKNYILKSGKKNIKKAMNRDSTLNQLKKSPNLKSNKKKKTIEKSNPRIQ